MKILKLCYEYPPLGGGGSHVVAGLSDQLVTMGHRIDLVTMGCRNLPEAEFKQGFTVHRIACLRHSQVVCHPHEMLSYLIMALPRVLALSRMNSYDLIHAHFIFPDGILAWAVSRMTGLPYMITAHGSDVPGYNPDRFIFLHTMLRPLWKTVVQSCSRIVCLSQHLESLLKKTAFSARTTIIPNGFGAGRFRSGKKSDKILVVTRMFRRKGVQHLLCALKDLNIDHEIHIVGDGPYLDELKQLSEVLMVPVKFHGFIENDSDYFKFLMETSRIFVFPSEVENFPIVLLEAMDAGMAIITTRNTGCEEVVGDTAMLTNPGDVMGIRNVLEKLAADPELCRQFGETARKRLDENFSWPKVARRYESVYRSLIPLD